MPLLEVERLCKRFGGVRAVHEVSFVLEEGELLGIMGPNGSGKTTLFNLIAGALRPDAGRIRFAGTEIGGRPPHRVCAAGVARTFQLVRPFPGLTALENVLVGGLYGRARATTSAAATEARRLLRVLGLEARADEPAARLTLIDRKRLELARALATSPRLLLLDEFMAGLNPMETAAATWGAARVLEIRGLEAGYGDVPVLSGVTLAVGAGEIVALLGPNGAGKSTLLNCVAGLVRPPRRGRWAGTIRWDGQDLRALDAHLIVQRGVALVPEGRRLFGGMSVQENLELGAFAPRAWAGRRAAVERVYTLFPVLAERRRTAVQALSGGQQQMVAVGRALMASPRLLMLDEPSLGLAPRLVAAILEALVAINRAGVAVFLVEQNVPAALSLAHRGYLLEGGRIVGEGSGVGLMANEDVRRAYLGPLAVRR